VNTATKITELPALTADLLQSNSCLVDNLFADLWKQMGMKALFRYPKEQNHAHSYIPSLKLAVP
jgi:hypothetical protein